MFWTIVIIVAIIGAIIGFASSDKKKPLGALAGAFVGGASCFIILLQIALYLAFPILILVWLFS